MVNSILEELLSSYNDLTRFLTRRLGNRHDADDLAQSSFERVYAHSLSETIISPRALLFRTAQNLVVDRVRRTKRQQTDATPTEQLAELTDNAPTVDRLADARRQVERLRGIIAELPPRTREIFVLHRLEELTYVQVAQRLGISESSVQKHLAKALLYVTQRLMKP
jgi:RNA polymerase sigma-70 factor (ECF subfamily)